MADIFREVDEEVRKDKFQILWKKFGVYVYVVIGALILGTAFNAYWRFYKQEQRLEDAARYGAAVSLLKRQQTTEAINGFAGLADESGTGYAVVGRFREAAARADAGDLTGAIRAYDRLAEDDGVAFDLQCQFACRGDHQCARRHPAFAFWRWRGLVHHVGEGGDQERGGFPCARLGLAGDVLAFQRERQGFGLDRGAVGEYGIADSVNHRFRNGKAFKSNLFHVQRRPVCTSGTSCL